MVHDRRGAGRRGHSELESSRSVSERDGYQHGVPAGWTPGSPTSRPRWEFYTGLFGWDAEEI